jgi:hypothetical protein
MRKNKKTYTCFQSGSAVFMILALLWLTVSAPFAFASQQELAKQNKIAKASAPLTGNEEDAANPFGNNTEEKAPGSSNSLSEEYLHDHHIADHYFSIVLRYHKGENTDTYIAFHGELLVPPPDVA